MTPEQRAFMERFGDLRLHTASKEDRKACNSCLKAGWIEPLGYTFSGRRAYRVTRSGQLAMREAGVTIR